MVFKRLTTWNWVLALVLALGLGGGVEAQAAGKTKSVKVSKAGKARPVKVAKAPTRKKVVLAAGKRSPVSGRAKVSSVQVRGKVSLVRASAPAKIEGTNFGSTAFITWVALCSRATDATTSGSLASTCAVANFAATSSPCRARIQSTVRAARDSS